MCSAVTATYITPFEEGLSGQAKTRRAGRLRERPAFHDIVQYYLKGGSKVNDVVEPSWRKDSGTIVFKKRWWVVEVCAGCQSEARR